uniref:Uncharacterized protein n=1 Tax=Romanomermis culicivorax TaxID=13658 RepID=A0A915IS11_ROMCU
GTGAVPPLAVVGVCDGHPDQGLPKLTDWELLNRVKHQFDGWKVYANIQHPYRLGARGSDNG